METLLVVAPALPITLVGYLVLTIAYGIKRKEGK